MIGSPAPRRGRVSWVAALTLAITLAAPIRSMAKDEATSVPGDSAADAVAAIPSGSPAGGAAATEAVSTPDEVVEVFHVALIEMMKKSGEMSFDERVAYLMPVMDESFDLGFMSAKSVGRQWKELSAGEQAEWRQKFSELTVSNYAGRFVDYSGEMFSTVGNEPAARNTVMVLTRLDVPGDEAVDMNYRLRKSRDGWRIIDIYLKGTVSELALRRSEYSSTLKRDGFEKLAAAIEKKITELREDSDG